MSTIKYKLLSGTQEKPIKVVVDASAAFATISWVYEITVGQDSCSSCVTVGNQSETIMIEPLECGNSGETSSSLTWNNLTVFYHLVQKEEECPITCEDKPTITNELIANRVWVTPYDVYCNHETKEVKLHYEYYQITKLCDKIVKKEKKVKNVPIIVECDCSSDGGRKDGNEFEAPEGFTLTYAYNCIVNFKCDCNGFSFKDGSTTSCDCDGFRFVDGSGGDCSCKYFAFIDDGDCICNNFDFKE